MRNTRNRILATTLTILLIASLPLAGCGALSRIGEQQAAPHEPAAKVELTNLLRAGSAYKGIEILHGTTDEPTYSPDGKAYLYDTQGWIYLHIEGAPAARGYQHGWLLADYIQLQRDYYASMLANIHAIDWQYFKTNAERLWAHKVEPEYQAELEGMVEGAAERGATVDYLDLLVLNGLEELRECWFPTVREQYYAELAAGLWSPENTPGFDESTGASVVQGSTADEPSSGSPASGSSASDNSASDSSASSGTSQDSPTSTNTAGDSSSGSLTSDSPTQDSLTPSNSSDEKLALLPYEEIEGVTQLGQSGSLPSSVREFTLQTGPSNFSREASAILATGSVTASGTILLVHNTTAAYADSHFSNVIIDLAPTEGERFTMKAAPGFIHSEGEAYSSTSLVVANTRINGFNVYDEAGTPEFLRIRRAVQYAKTLDDFTARMLEGVNGGLASSWLVGQLSNNQIMELELGLSFYNVQKITNGYFFNFNGVDDSRILDYETNGSGFTDTRLGPGSRSERLQELGKLYAGTLDVKLAQTIISDHYDGYRNKAVASSRSICAHYEADDAAYTAGFGIEPYMPCGTVAAEVMTTELAKEHAMVARWGSACGKAFDSQTYLQKNPRYAHLEQYLYDRPSQLWSELKPLGSRV